MPRWLARIFYAMRGKRRVRLFLDVPQGRPDTMEGVLIGRWSGHYILMLPQLVNEQGEHLNLEGEVEVPSERVMFVQVMRG